jgi:O-methyltransferase
LTLKENLYKLIQMMLVHSPINYSERTDSALRLTLLRRWIKKYRPEPFFESRNELYKYIGQKVGANTPVIFMEFGVYRGASLLEWIKLNTSEKSEFIGFDSFEGLPEDWVGVGGRLNRNTFSTDGKLPIIKDNRVRLIKGWFQDTLPLFQNQNFSDKQIIIHFDADLYSSTMYVLCKLDSYIKPGTIIIFDEFSSMLHEFRALEDYTRAFRREYVAAGAAGEIAYYGQIAIRITG